MAVNPACKIFIPQLSIFVDGELSPSDRVAVERHLSACPECTMRVADFRAESGLLRVGMEMLADEVDFKDFSQKVMARLTPERLPLLERLKLSLHEMFIHQRGMWMTSLATAALVLMVAVPVLLRQRTPEGYGSERLEVQTVSIDGSSTVAPVVMETDSGDAIIFVVEDAPEKVRVPATGEESTDELDAVPSPDLRQPPTGGEL